MMGEIIPEQDTVSMLRALSEEEFQMLTLNQERILKDHNARQIPTIQALFPTLGNKAKKAKDLVRKTSGEL